MSENAQQFTSVYSDHFAAQLLELPDGIYGSVSHSIDLLEGHPHLGRPYDPTYEHDLPPVPIESHYVPDTTKRLFYLIDEEAHRLYFVHMADTRQDPRNVFGSSWTAETPWL